MRRPRFGFIPLLGAFAVVAMSAGAGAQSKAPEAPIAIPKEATALKGTPTVRVDSTTEGTTRRRLTPTEGNQFGLKIDVKDGRYYWTNHRNQPLTVQTSGEFTYLSSTEPGQYIKFRRLNDRIAYVEHLDMGLGTVTYWGELQIELGR